MIPTQYKAKLPNHLSYPVGAGRLSDALVDVPQIQELSVSFSDSVFGFKSKFLEALRNGLPYPIISVNFLEVHMPFGSNSMAAQGWYGPRWEIWVHPVPRGMVREAREQVERVGLPAIRTWLVKRKAWDGPTFSVRFSTASRAIVL